MEDWNASFHFNGIKYEWLGQSTVRLTAEDGFTVYFDPVMLDPAPAKAGLILITHHHVDHCLPEFVTPIRDDNTKLAAYHESYIKYCVKDIKGVRTVKIGQTLDLSGVAVTGVEAYTPRGFHMKGEGCGFLVELRGQRIYFSGDTAKIEEMEEIKDIDVAILPICDNAYAIDTAEIVKAVKFISPKVFIPVHFTPEDDPEPKIEAGMLFSKDPRFFTRKADPFKAAQQFEGTGIKVAVLKKLGKYKE
ncbi:MAG: MBL fold metallo-hydrolase [Deltaproteobacteria bacterium]|nr:MBL fold metallo-hydrolase [Deltaproteobacteria bacterium]